MNALELRKAIKLFKKKEIIDFLDEFMTLKNMTLLEIIVFPEEDNVFYWKDLDRRILEKYKKVELEEMLYLLINSIERIDVIKPFRALDCPFCLLHFDNCEKCIYGRVKGQCPEPNSTYLKISDLIDALPSYLKDELMDNLKYVEGRWFGKVIYDLEQRFNRAFGKE